MAELQGHEIRLLHFSNQRFNLSDEATRPLKLGTTTHGRDVAPPYIALSYVWGDAKSQQTVIVDGRAVLMRRNLHAALLHIRQTIDKARKHPKRILGFDLSGRPRYSSELGQISHIWADAQCIDQTNVYERNSQVRSMGETFKMATCVFAWTGVLSLSDSRILDKYYMYPHVPPELDQWAGIEILEITTASTSQGAPTIDNQRISTGRERRQTSQSGRAIHPHVVRSGASRPERSLFHVWHARHLPSIIHNSCLLSVRLIVPRKEHYTHPCSPC
nr:hypothetical protein B0A51_13063 [Rachicladosporium sp. CCFEE 5018]